MQRSITWLAVYRIFRLPRAKDIQWVSFLIFGSIGFNEISSAMSILKFCYENLGHINCLVFIDIELSVLSIFVTMGCCE